MYPMVQQQQQPQPQQQAVQQFQQPPQQSQRRHHHHDHQQQQQTTEEGGEETGGLKQHRSHRPLYRRFFSYVREAWTGVKFALDSELEDLETPPRYRPDSLEALCKATRFTQAEIKRIYRGFKAECPTGVVKEETFKMIYSQFFPQGANTSQYAHYVFNTLDQDHSGLISFEDFVQNLSILSRGSLDEKLRWAFTLYDINGDGYITREEMTDIVSAIYDLMGKVAEPCVDEDTVKEKVDRIFQAELSDERNFMLVAIIESNYRTLGKFNGATLTSCKMDKNRDGVVTLDEFLECCRKDEDISSSMAVFDSSI